MIRMGLKHVGCALLLILFSVATASAECAWVLWAGEWFDAREDGVRSLLYASATQADCLAAMERAAQAFKDKMGSGAVIGRDPREPWAVMVFGQGHSVTIRCLPDTVDPRGPKTK
jgi:hypothetical protein